MTPPESPFSQSVPLVQVERGGVVECVHRGSVVIVRGDDVPQSFGDPTVRTYYRSTAKPFQAMVVVTSGAADRYDLSAEELAIAAGSHDATPRQLDVVRSMLEKAGVAESELQCGGHWSISAKQARRQAIERGTDTDTLPAIWSNCSGKHAGMLAAANAMALPLARYLEPTHPVQRQIHDICSGFARVRGEQAHRLHAAVDGCGAPIHSLSLEAMARSWARLADPSLLPAPEQEQFAEAARQMGAAMSAHPDMVAGEERFDTDLMTSAKTRILCKAGAEGVQGVAVPAHGLGLAVKVDDGSDRGYQLVVIELLRRLGVLRDEEADGLAERHGRTIRNKAGADVGRLRVAL